MAVVTLTEYLEIDAVPLATPAWSVLDLSELYTIADTRGDVLEVPYLRGGLHFRRQLGPKRVALPLDIYGEQDENGAAHPNVREGLQTNRDTLVRDVLRPLQVATAGDRLARHHLADGSIRSGPVQLAGGLNPVGVAPGVLRATLELVFPEGGLRSETLTDVTSAIVPDAGSDTLAVPNAGLDYQDAATYILTGTATAVTITNDTADAGGSVWLSFGGPLGGGVTFDTRNYTATRDGVNVVGLVTDSGHERWLPLVPGSNSLRIEPTGGTAQLRAQHYPFFP